MSERGRAGLRGGPRSPRARTRVLQVDVELEARVRPRRRGGRVPRRGRAVRAGRRPRGRGPGPSAVAAVARRTRSCRRRPQGPRRRWRACSRARSRRRPCGRPARGLAGSVGSALTRRAPVRGAVVVALAAGADRSCRTPAREAPAAVDPGALASGPDAPSTVTMRPPRSAERRMSGRALDHREGLVVGDAPRAPRVEPARKQPSDFQTFPNPATCAGRAGRRRWRASDRPRAGGAGSRAVELLARARRVRARQGAGRSAPGPRSSARAPGRRTGPPRARRCG